METIKNLSTKDQVVLDYLFKRELPDIPFLCYESAWIIWGTLKKEDQIIFENTDFFRSLITSVLQFIKIRMGDNTSVFDKNFTLEREFIRKFGEYKTSLGLCDNIHTSLEFLENRESEFDSLATEERLSQLEELIKDLREYLVHTMHVEVPKKILIIEKAKYFFEKEKDVYFLDIKKMFEKLIFKWCTWNLIKNYPEYCTVFQVGEDFDKNFLIEYRKDKSVVCKNNVTDICDCLRLFFLVEKREVFLDVVLYQLEVFCKQEVKSNDYETHLTCVLDVLQQSLDTPSRPELADVYQKKILSIITIVVDNLSLDGLFDDRGEKIILDVVFDVLYLFSPSISSENVQNFYKIVDTVYEKILKVDIGFIKFNSIALWYELDTEKLRWVTLYVDKMKIVSKQFSPSNYFAVKKRFLKVHKTLILEAYIGFCLPKSIDSGYIKDMFKAFENDPDLLEKIRLHAVGLVDELVQVAFVNNDYKIIGDLADMRKSLNK